MPDSCGVPGTTPGVLEVGTNTDDLLARACLGEVIGCCREALMERLCVTVTVCDLQNQRPDVAACATHT